MAIINSISNIFRSLFNKQSNGGIRLVPGYSDTNEVVNVKTAQTSTVFAQCLDILASDLGSLPFPVYHKTDEGRTKAVDHPIYRLLNDSPNPYMTSQNWREYQMYDLLLYGNAYNVIERGANGDVIAIYPIPPSEIVINKKNLTYRINGIEQVFGADEILHFVGLPWDGVQGRSVVESHASSIGITLATDKYASRYFGTGVALSGTIQVPSNLSPEAAKETLTNFAQTYGGAGNSHKVAVLSNGATWNPQAASTNAQSQFLESRHYNAIDICRLPGFRIPPHMVGEMSDQKYATVEAQGIDYVRYTLRRWILKIESEVNRKLWKEQEKAKGYYAEMSVDAIQRGDIAARYAAYSVGRQWGWLSSKQIASFENLNGPNYTDELYSPLNMTTGPLPTQQPEPPVAEPQVNSIVRNALSKEERRARYRLILEDQIKRCTVKESKAISRLCSKCLPTDTDGFVNGVAAHCEKHTECVRDSVRSTCLTYSPKKADHIIHNMVESFKNETLNSIDAALQQPEPDKAVCSVLEQWNDRHIQFADNFVSGKYE